MRASFFDQRKAMPGLTGSRSSGPGLAAAIGRYIAAAAVVAAAGTWLPFIGLEIAEAMGWRTSFVGTIFVAAATSLPELVVTIAALRLGAVDMAVDMAVGNLLGRNLFDILVLAIDDLAYTDGSLLASSSPANAGSVCRPLTEGVIAEQRLGGRLGDTKAHCEGQQIFDQFVVGHPFSVARHQPNAKPGAVSGGVIGGRWFMLTSQ